MNKPKVKWSPLMRERMAFLKDQFPAKYQEMKDNGTLMNHLLEVDEQYGEIASKTYRNLLIKWEKDNNTKISDLYLLKQLEVRNLIESQTKEIAYELVIYAKI